MDHTDRTDPVRLLDLQERPLDVAEVMTALEHPAAGGVSVFVGRVRDHDGGRTVEHLDYSAHPTAAARLREVADRVVAAYDVLALAAVHRTGHLKIGDLAVVVGVATAHRDQAFAACRMLIDDLKAEVPVWKHQVFADGTDEWVGTP